MPCGKTLRESRVLKPFAPYLDRHFLWQINRKAVAGGVAVGLFFGILSPVAQIFLATIGAIFLRVNLPVAAFGTFVTNPLTVAPLYYCAYLIGDFLTGGANGHAGGARMNLPDLYGQLRDALVSVPAFYEWSLSIGLPLMLGLAVLASAIATLAYASVQGLWLVSVRRRWSKRRTRSHQLN